MSPEHGLQSTWPTEPAGSGPPRRHPLAFFKELPVLIVVAFGLALLMKTFLLQMFFIPSESMVPTLLVNDRVAVNKLAYRFREPQRGEVIVFIAQADERDRSVVQRITDFLTDGLGFTRPMEQDFIKRIIGLPGETIRVNKKRVRITTADGRRMRLDEPYIRLDGGENFSTFGPFTVPDDQFFVMGDNRNNSSDSRSSLGPIARDEIIGKAFVKIWPPTRVDLIDEPTYGERTAEDTSAAGQPGAGAPGWSAIPAALALVAMTTVGASRRRRR